MISRRVLLRCDAGSVPEIGTGHLHRCLVLADEVRRRGAHVSFCGRFDESSMVRIADACFAVVSQDGEDESALVIHAAKEVLPDILVVDRLASSWNDLAAVRDLVPVILTVDDVGPGAELADIVINAHVGSGDHLYDSYDYVIIAPPPHRVGSHTPGGDGQRPRVVISVGGYDHRGLGAQVAEALTQVVDGQIEWLVRSGSVAAAPAGVTLVEDVPDFAEALRQADVAVVNGGLTVFEALANGVASVGLAQYSHQAATLARLERSGAVVFAGEASPEAVASARDAVVMLLNDDTQRTAIRRRGAEVVDGGGLSRAADLVMLVERLPWDTEFFGVEIARLYPQRLTERILEFALRECESQGIECLYYLSDCHHAPSVRMAEAAGFNFVDIRLTFERSLSGDIPHADLGIRLATTDDLEPIKAIARDAYPDSRYFFDHHFPREDCQRFYTDWMTKCVTGELAEKVFVLDDDEGLAGYIALTHEAPATAAIVFVGVAERSRAAGLGTRLVKHAAHWAADAGYSRMQVVTQGRNYRAQRFYQRAGYVTAKTELWYHKWWR